MAPWPCSGAWCGSGGRAKRTCLRVWRASWAWVCVCVCANSVREGERENSVREVRRGRRERAEKWIQHIWSGA